MALPLPSMPRVARQQPTSLQANKPAPSSTCVSAYSPYHYAIERTGHTSSVGVSLPTRARTAEAVSARLRLRATHLVPGVPRSTRLHRRSTLQVHNGENDEESSAEEKTATIIYKYDRLASGNDIRVKLPTCLLLGVATAFMGKAYALCLNTMVDAVWTTIPQKLQQAGVAVDPLWYIPLMFTLGGTLVGTIAATLPTVAPAEFIANMRSSTKELPALRFLWPVLLISMVTSAFGFSVGPEAPMVVAGGLMGAALSQHLYPGEGRDHRTLAYAGAAGALTTFIGMPVAGAIFCLELTRASTEALGTGMAKEGYQAFGPAVAASVASMLAIKLLIAPGAAAGGHFVYHAPGAPLATALTGLPFASVCLGAAVGGAVVGRVFVALVGALKAAVGLAGKRPILVRALVGLAVGLLSVYFPQTVFWSEGLLQTAVDGQQTALAATKHGLSPLLSSRALVPTGLPFAGSWAAAQVGAAKVVAIAMACAGGFPGGIIFPLFFAGAALAHAGPAWFLLPGLQPVWVMCLMAALQASATRTPLATVFMLGLSAAPHTQLSVILPPVICASYLGVFVSRMLSDKTYFPYPAKD